MNALRHRGEGAKPRHSCEGAKPRHSCEGATRRHSCEGPLFRHSCEGPLFRHSCEGRNPGLRAAITRLLVPFLFIFTSAAFAADGTDILKKVDRNLEPESYEMYRKLVNVEPDGSSKEFVLYTAKKGRDKVAALFLAPASDKGRATLRLGDNMWLHIPAVGKPVRITSLQSVTGGVFNNADILRIDYSDEYTVESMQEDKDAFVLRLKAKTGEVAYDKLHMWVDRKALLPSKIEAFAASGMLIKTLHFSDVKDFGGGIKRPAKVETDSPLFKGYKSVMLYSALKRRELKDETFTLTNLPRIDELRK